jgi:3-hydroxyisobutyrate dehydrogenase-like beta-hydroxyacid dehydrogenase
MAFKIGFIGLGIMGSRPDFPMRWMQKDLHLASISGYEAGVPMPVVNVTKELYRLAMRDGYTDEDYGAIFAFLNRTSERDATPAAPDYTTNR